MLEPDLDPELPLLLEELEEAMVEDQVLKLDLELLLLDRGLEGGLLDELDEFPELPEESLLEELEDEGSESEELVKLKRMWFEAMGEGSDGSESIELFNEYVSRRLSKSLSSKF